MYSETQNTFQGSQKHLYIPIIPSRITQKQFEKIMKNHIFGIFFLIRTQRPKQLKYGHFQAFLCVKKISEKPQDHQNLSHHQTNVENVFRDINLTQEDDINSFQHFDRAIQKMLGEGPKIPPPKKISSYTELLRSVWNIPLRGVTLFDVTKNMQF